MIADLILLAIFAALDSGKSHSRNYEDVIDKRIRDEVLFYDNAPTNSKDD